DRKLNLHAKQIATGFGLAQNVIYRIFAFGFRPLHERLSETSLLKFFRRYAVAGDVLDSVLRPDELVDSHAVILRSAHTRPCPQSRAHGSGHGIIRLARLPLAA